MAYFGFCRARLAAVAVMVIMVCSSSVAPLMAQARGSIKEGERREVYNGKFARPFSICSNKSHGNMILTHDGEKTVLGPGKCASFEAKKLTVYSEPDRRPKSQPKRRCYEKYTYSSGRGSGGMGRVNRSQQCN